MITQSLYFELCVALAFHLDYRGSPPEAEGQSFLVPYVLVIHCPSRRGFYLDREYRHIIDVSGCQEPNNPIEMKRHHLCAGPDIPQWAIVELEHNTDMFFDTFWLY